MLTIKAPIRLKCGAPIVPSYESFYHRIMGNYQLLAANITREDLYHVIAAPPEVYLGEGGMTSIVNNTQMNSRQQMKIEVINNLLNRIVLGEDIHLTYQDRVFITEVLSRMGVKNVQEFMRQVLQLRQETNNAEQLINLYWNYMQDVSRTVEEYKEQSTEQYLTEEQAGETVRLHLHEEILNRLQTGAIYQILSNFYTGQNRNSWYISSQEMQITEQKRISSRILLNQLRSVAQGEPIPLIYRHENYYENLDLEETQVSDTDISSQITSAILLDLVDNLYQNRIDRQFHQHGPWLHTQRALYLAAENTIYRLREGAMNRYAVRERQEFAYYQRRIQERELQSAERLLEMREAVERIYLEREEGPGEEQVREVVREHVEQYLQILRIPQRIEPALSVPERILAYRAQEMPAAAAGALPEAETADGVSEGAQSAPGEVIRRILEREYGTVTRREIPETSEEFQASRIEHTAPEEEPEEAELLHPAEEPQETSREEEQAEQELVEELRRINQRNIENLALYRQIREIQEEQTRSAGRVENPMERMRRESLLALTNPQQLFEEYRQEQEAQEERQARRAEEITQLLPEQTRRIFEMARQRQDHPEQFLPPGNLSLVHKSTENQLDEELLEQINQQNLQKSVRTEVVRQVEEQRQVTDVSRTIQEENRQTVIRQEQDIDELIRRGVQRQMGALSDQIYSKLEKRLEREKRRRGY